MSGGHGHLFVSNLRYDTVDESALFQLFNRYVGVKSARIVRDSAVGSKGYGFIELVDERELMTALALDGLSFHGRAIRVRMARWGSR